MDLCRLKTYTILLFLQYKVPITPQAHAHFDSVRLALASNKDNNAFHTSIKNLLYVITSLLESCNPPIDIVWECQEIIQLKRSAHAMGTPVVLREMEAARNL